MLWFGTDRRIIAPHKPLASALDLKIASGDSVDVWAFVGHWKQLRILPPSSELSKLRDRYEAVGRAKTEPDRTRDDAVLVRRKLDDFYRVRLRSRTQSNSFRLTLPYEVVDLDLLRTDEAIVLAIAGGGVELWRRDRWTDVARIEDVETFMEEADDLIEGGDD